MENLAAELKEQKRINKETGVAINKAKGRITKRCLELYEKADEVDNKEARVRLVGMAFGASEAGDIINECLRVRGVKK